MASGIVWAPSKNPTGQGKGATGSGAQIIAFPIPKKTPLPAPDLSTSAGRVAYLAMLIEAEIKNPTTEIGKQLQVLVRSNGAIR